MATTLKLDSSLEMLRAILPERYPAYARTLVGLRASAVEGSPWPPSLIALLQLADGAEGFFVGRGAEGKDLLSVSQCRAIAEALAADLPEGAVPFAKDGAGNYLVVDRAEKVFDWDHETRNLNPLKRSLPDLVDAVAKAAASGKFRGGPEVAPNAALERAKKQIASGKADVFKVVELAEKSKPKDAVAVLEALVAKTADPEARDGLAKAYARAEQWDDAVATAKTGRFAQESTLFDVGCSALDGGAWAGAEAAFGSLSLPSPAALVGLAIARKRQAKRFDDVLEQVDASAAEGPVNWTSATSCYEYVARAVARAMAAAVRGDGARAAATLADARERVRSSSSRAVQKACDESLAQPTSPAYWTSRVARHAGL